MILNEAVKKGDVEEIKLNNAILILKKIKESPFVCVLITNKPLKLLMEALDAFAQKFFKKFSHEKDNVHETSKFDEASELISACFSFFPRYD